MRPIFTATWFAPIPDDHIRIGVSRGSPRGFAAGYRKFKALFPGAWFNKVEPAEYLKRYDEEILAPLDPQKTLDRIMELSGDKTPVLCCYEAAPKIQTGELWCHRHIDAQWFEDRLGITVPELDFPNLDRFAKLKLLGIAPPSYKAIAL